MGMRVRYISDIGHFDGLIFGQVYEVDEELELQYVIFPNVLGGTSTVMKDKFEIMDTAPKMADTDGDLKPCTCDHPSGFKFVASDSDHQTWEHVQCGGLVTRTFIRSGEVRSLLN